MQLTIRDWHRRMLLYSSFLRRRQRVWWGRMRGALGMDGMGEEDEGGLLVATNNKRKLNGMYHEYVRAMLNKNRHIHIPR